ncbi:MAG: 3-phosphoshikimate 1-carboxyvinyltransferase [Acidimicrobiales bacterium]
MSETAQPLGIVPLARPPDADVELPGSKSETNRALVCAALAVGTSSLRQVLLADDTEAMLGCLTSLGVDVTVDRDERQVVVQGTSGSLPPGPATLDARMSGTTARFVAPVLALGRGRYRLTGHPQLLARPMAPSLAALRDLGVTVEDDAAPGHLPVTVDGSGTLAGGRVALAADVSSQFMSGLLLAAPCMEKGLLVDVTTPAVSRPYLDLTAAVMRLFGATVEHAGDTWTVHPGGYRAADLTVEPDASAASYFFAAAAICGGRVRVPGLGRTTAQGDLRFVQLLAEMGADVEVSDRWTEVRGAGELWGVDVDLADLSDTAPTLAVVAACATGPTRVRGVGFIRRKETDRIAAIVTELRRCGVDAVEETDGFVVRPAGGGPHGAVVATYDDHRMAMSFAVLGLRIPGIEIADPGCVAKTFPDYFEVLDRLRVA